MGRAAAARTRMRHRPVASCAALLLALALVGTLALPACGQDDGFDFEEDFEEEAPAAAQQQQQQQQRVQPPPVGQPAGSGTAGGHSADIFEEEDEYFDDFADLPKDSHLLDEDEFEGVGSVPVAAAGTPRHKAAQDAAPAAAEKPKPVVPPKPLHWTDFKWEMAAAISILAYLLNYLRGSSTNRAFASAWADANAELLKSNFAFVGPSKEDSEDLLIQESASEYVLYATGRRFCKSFTANLNLLGRHDLLAIMSNLMVPASDDLTIHVDLEHKTLDGFIFCVAEKRMEKKLKGELDDLRSLTTSYTGEKWQLPGNLVVMTDCPDIVPRLLTDEVRKLLTAQKDEIDFMHFSDQFMSQPADADDSEFIPEVDMNHKLMFRFRLPKSQPEAIRATESIMKMAMHFVNALPGIKLQGQAKLKSEKKRAAFIKDLLKSRNKQLASKARERRDAKKQAEKESYQAKGPEALAKYEEREKKRLMKKKMPRMKAKAI